MAKKLKDTLQSIMVNYDPFRIKERESKSGKPVGRSLVLENLIKENNLKTGAELGVRAGENYYYLLAHCPDLELLGVDLFQIQPEGAGEGHRRKTFEKPEHGFSYDFESYYKLIQELQKEFGPRAKFIRDWTTEAVKQIPDNSLDFIFLDADHAYKTVVRDIEDWNPKVKKGGYITGHDWYQSPVKKAVTDVLGRKDIQIKQDNVWIYRKKND